MFAVRFRGLPSTHVRCNLWMVRADGPVHYDGNEYTLHSSVATAPKAEQSCSSFGAHLASFGTMAEYYMATKALFDTDTGYLLHQVGRAQLSCFKTLFGIFTRENPSLVP